MKLRDLELKQDYISHTGLTAVGLKDFLDGEKILDDKVFLPTLGLNLQRDYCWNIQQKKEKDKSGEYPDQNTIWSFKALPAAQYQPPQQAYAPAPPVQPQQLIRTGETAFDANGKPIFKAADGQWYYG